MIRLRPAAARGRYRNGWLDARFSFSFGAYRDPAYDGYSDLLVLNDDVVVPSGGFAEHPHRDMEVMSYPLAGTVEHRDSLGNVAILRPGDVHLMRAGSGIRHSEMNASALEPERHLQWWIVPARSGLAPDYARIHVAPTEKRGVLRLIGSPDGAGGSLEIAQDARVYASLLAAGARVAYEPAPGRRTYVHLASGTMVLNGRLMKEGDGAFVEREDRLELAGAGTAAEVLVFDLR